MDRLRTWPPRPELSLIPGQQGLSVTWVPEYLKGIDFNDRENWSIEQWQTYARYLEEKGRQFIDELKRERDIARVALTLQAQKASRKKKKKFNSGREAIIDALMSRPAFANPGGLLSSLNRPVIDAPFPNIPKQHRGRPKDENLQSMKLARLALEKQTQLEAQGMRVTSKEALEAVCDELSFSRIQKRQIMQNRNIQNRISTLRNQNNSKR